MSTSHSSWRDWDAAWLWLLLALLLASPQLLAGSDPRLRSVLYSADEVYRLPARIGYEIDLEFELGERFVGLGAGDIEAVSFRAEGNHLFIKPKALNVDTNMTVLTNRRIYHFDYATMPPGSVPDQVDVLYALRFLYAPPPSLAVAAAARPPPNPQQLLSQVPAPARRNTDYWYCGARGLQPVAAWDDGVHTHLRFGARAELPAVFVRNDDGSESLVNFTIVNDEMTIHRVVRRLVLRRGRLVGCILNQGFVGAGASLSSGTVSPQVERSMRTVDDERVP